MDLFYVLCTFMRFW